MIRGMEHLSYEERLRVEAVQPGEEKALGRSYSSLPLPEGGLQKKPEEGLFTRACSDRGNSLKLKEHRFRLDIRKKFFTMRAVE